MFNETSISYSSPSHLHHTSLSWVLGDSLHRASLCSLTVSVGVRKRHHRHNLYEAKNAGSAGHGRSVGHDGMTQLPKSAYPLLSLPGKNGFICDDQETISHFSTICSASGRR